MSCQHQSGVISQSTSRPGTLILSGQMGVSSNRMKILHPHLAGADPIDPDVCHGCGGLDPWSLGSRGLFYGKENRGEMQFVRQTDVGSLKTGKEQGCIPCRLIILGLEDFTETDIQNEGTVVKIFIAAEKNSRSLVVGPRKKDRVELYIKNGAPSPWPAIGPMEHVYSNSGSDFGMFIVKDWVRNCLENHKDCCPPGPFELPSRVLDVSSHDSDMYLHLPRGEKAHYIALSHCWGPIQPCKTTSGNVEERRAGIPFQVLPKTYQDVITLARALSVRFVWIDSLCIVQDDPADWQRESAAMSTVYRNALLTVAAIRSPDGNKGLFASRPYAKQMVYPAIKEGEPDLRICFRKPILTHSIFSYGFHDADASQYPLEDRAWCFQERILSTRIVHYTNDELVWECNGANTCECGFMQSATQEATLREYFRMLLEAENLNRAEIWMEIVTKFSRRKLTFESDRLPAISGLVRSLQEQGFGEYLAGIWVEALPRQLLWTAQGGERTPTYRAPTWSFASVEAEAINDCCDNILPGKKSIHLKVLEAAVVPTGQDPRGTASSGHLKVSGPVQAATVFWDYVRWKEGKGIRYYIEILGLRNEVKFDYPVLKPLEDAILHPKAFDTPPKDRFLIDRLVPMMKKNHVDDGDGLEPLDGLNVTLLAVCTENLRLISPGQGRAALWCLILKKSDQVAGVLERIVILGLNRPNEPQEWLAQAEISTLTIL